MTDVNTIYFTETSLGTFQLEAMDLDEAISHVQHHWANSGRVKLIERVYTDWADSIIEVNTDYGDEDDN